jgi:hypothetical protein
MRTPRFLVVSALVGLAACSSATTAPRSEPEPEPEEPGNTSPDAGSSVRPDAAAPAPKPDARAEEPPIPTGKDAGGADTGSAPVPTDASVPTVPDAGGVAEGPAFGVGSRTSMLDALTKDWTRVRETITDESGMKVFTGVFEANKFGGPQGHTHRLPIKAAHEYLLEYKVRFNADFPFMRGGKLPGLAGGNAPTGCVDTDLNGFSARHMWRTGGQLVAYLYDQDQGGDCGNNITTSLNFKTQKWYAIKQRVKLNTARNHDGELQISVDGQMLVDRKNLEYMSVGPAANLINVILFHSFFGGSTQDWAPTRQCSLSFADLFVTLLAE